MCMCMCVCVCVCVCVWGGEERETERERKSRVQTVRLRPCCRPEASAKSIPTRLGKGFGLQLQNAQLMRVPVCRRDTSHQAFVLHPPFDCPSVHLVICCDITLSLHLAVAGPVCDFYQSVNSRRDKSKTRHEAQKKPIIGFNFDLNTCADSDGSWGDESVTSLAVGGSIPGHSSPHPYV